MPSFSSLENPFAPKKDYISDEELVRRVSGEKAAADYRRLVGPTEEKPKKPKLTLEELEALEVASRPEGEMSPELRELVFEQCAKLEAKLNARYAKFGLPEAIKLNPENIALPENLSREHLEAIADLFPNAFAERILPTLEDLNNVDENYVKVMYPKKQQAFDTNDGLISTTNVNDQELASMRKELEKLGGSLILLDPAVKPEYRGGKQHYGSIEGADPSLDPLLPLFQECFGQDANRFSHSWDDLNEKLLPLAKKKIEERFVKEGLPIPDFDVILVPALLDNQEMTLHNPKSSSTNTWEWTSTPLLDDSGADTNRRLRVGYSGGGGAGDVDSGVRGVRDGLRGSRLAVVFVKRD